MSNTYLLSVLASGMALLLWPAQGTQSKPDKQAIRSVQQERPSTRVDVEDDEREMDMDVDTDMDLNVQEPQIDIDMDLDIEVPQVDMDPDVDTDEPDMDVDHDDGDREEIDHEDASFTEHEQEKIEKSFAMPASAGRRTLEIDNVWGSIEVVGTASDQAHVTVDKNIRAESKGKIDQAKKEVTLDVTQQAEALKLYVNGPFRCDCHDCGRSRDDDGYVVKMDFPVKVSFRQNPKEASDFETVNGAIELQFARDLSADFRFKTFNGGIYSDFPVTALPVRGMQEERHGSKVIFRADRYTGARINAGGPQIKVENLNGDIRILENHE